MNNQVRTELLAALRKLRDEGPSRPDQGICGNLRVRLPENYLRERWKNWPHYSGVEGFPVPSSNRKTGPVGVYYHYISKWSRRTRYGRLRWALLDWLIEQLEKGDG